MGTKLLPAAFNAPVSPSERFLLVALADARNDKTGQCNPSQSTLAVKTGFSTRTIIRLLASLSEAGFLTVERDSRTAKNNYILHLEKTSKRSDSVSPARHDTASPATSDMVSPHRSDKLAPHEVTLTTLRSDIDDTKSDRISPRHNIIQTRKNPNKEPEVLTPPSGDVEKIGKLEKPKKPAKQTVKKPAPASEKKPRERDLLFDAIAEVCRLEPVVSGSVIGKCKQTLLKYNPPATPDEVRLFGQVYERKHPVNVVPTHGILANQFLLVRDKSTVERIMSGNNTPPRGLAAAAQAYRDRIEQYDPSKSRPLTPEEKAEIEQEDIPF